ALWLWIARWWWRLPYAARRRAARSCVIMRGRRAARSNLVDALGRRRRTRPWRGAIGMLPADLVYAVRSLRKSPLFTIAVLATVALAIGASTAIFSVVDSVLLRPLPFADPDRLVWAAERNDKLNLPTFTTSALNYLSWKEETRSLDLLGAIGGTSFKLSGQGEPEQLAGSTITPSVFPLLGLQAVAGRAFEEGEDRPSSTPVVMISEGLWKRRFGKDPAVIGRSLNLNGIDRTA